VGRKGQFCCLKDWAQEGVSAASPSGALLCAEAEWISSAGEVAQGLGTGAALIECKSGRSDRLWQKAAAEGRNCGQTDGPS